jgi:transcriptional regulator with XRE-family HTH domain
MNGSVSQLRVFRTAAGLSQKELAELAGVTAVTVCHVERGTTQPQRRTAEGIALALNVPAAILWPDGIG